MAVFDGTNSSAWFAGVVTSAGDKAIDKTNGAFNFQQSGVNKFQIKHNSTTDRLEINRGAGNINVVDFNSDGGSTTFYYDTEIGGHARINYNDPQLHFQRNAQDKFILGVDPTQDFFFLYSQPNK